MPPEVPRPAADPFPPTRWSLLDAAAADPAARMKALEDVAERYGGALFAVARRRGANAHEAEDLVQSFFEKLVADDDLFVGLDAGRGRFRAFLRTAFDRFAINRHEKAVAIKRGAGRVTSLDLTAAAESLASLPADPAAAFERSWAEGIVRRARERLLRERAAEGRGSDAKLIATFLAPGRAPPPLAEFAREHELTVPQLKSLVHRARVEFRTCVKDELLADGATPADLDAELAALTAALVG
jgi:DNA-directed RNA polymerase specialized sigma24 family protein